MNDTLWKLILLTRQ